MAELRRSDAGSTPPIGGSQWGAHAGGGSPGAQSSKRSVGRRSTESRLVFSRTTNNSACAAISAAFKKFTSDSNERAQNSVIRSVACGVSSPGSKKETALYTASGPSHLPLRKRKYTAVQDLEAVENIENQCEEKQAVVPNKSICLRSLSQIRCKETTSVTKPPVSSISTASHNLDNPKSSAHSCCASSSRGSTPRERKSSRLSLPCDSLRTPNRHSSTSSSSVEKWSRKKTTKKRSPDNKRYSWPQFGNPVPDSLLGSIITPTKEGGRVLRATPARRSLAAANSSEFTTPSGTTRRFHVSSKSKEISGKKVQIPKSSENPTNRQTRRSLCNLYDNSFVKSQQSLNTDISVASSSVDTNRRVTRLSLSQSILKCDPEESPQSSSSYPVQSSKRRRTNTGSAFDLIEDSAPVSKRLRRSNSANLIASCDSVFLTRDQSIESCRGTSSRFTSRSKRCSKAFEQENSSRSRPSALATTSATQVQNSSSVSFASSPSSPVVLSSTASAVRKNFLEPKHFPIAAQSLNTSQFVPALPSSANTYRPGSGIAVRSGLVAQTPLQQPSLAAGYIPNLSLYQQPLVYVPQQHSLPQQPAIASAGSSTNSHYQPIYNLTSVGAASNFVSETLSNPQAETAGLAATFSVLNVLSPPPESEPRRSSTGGIIKSYPLRNRLRNSDANALAAAGAAPPTSSSSSSYPKSSFAQVPVLQILPTESAVWYPHTAQSTSSEHLPASVVPGLPEISIGPVSAAVSGGAIDLSTHSSSARTAGLGPSRSSASVPPTPRYSTLVLPPATPYQPPLAVGASYGAPLHPLHNPLLPPPSHQPNYHQYQPFHSQYPPVVPAPSVPSLLQQHQPQHTGYRLPHHSWVPPFSTSTSVSSAAQPSSGFLSDTFRKFRESRRGQPQTDTGASSSVGSGSSPSGSRRGSAGKESRSSYWRSRSSANSTGSVEGADSSRRGAGGSSKRSSGRSNNNNKSNSANTGTCASTSQHLSACAGKGNNSAAGNSGMSSSAAGSSSTGTSGSRAASSGTGGTSASAAAAAAAAAVSAAVSSSLLDGVDDDSDMGRLETLLASRGLPPSLFGTLAPRMHHLLNRSSQSVNSKTAQLISGLTASGDEGQQLQALIEMCQLLVMGNEDTLAGFPVKQVCPALINLLNMEHNFDMMLHACRALTYMLEALPRSSSVIVEAVPVFLKKLQVIECMDVAEQSLTALEMLSRKHAKNILAAGGIASCLMFLDFFSIPAARAAIAITANCCQMVNSSTSYSFVEDSLPILAGRISATGDKKSVESACLAYSRLIDNFQHNPDKLLSIAQHNVLSNMQNLVVAVPPLLTGSSLMLVLRQLSVLCSHCPPLAVLLLRNKVADTLVQLLTVNGSAGGINGEELEVSARTPQEQYEIASLACELLPSLPDVGMFAIDNNLNSSRYGTLIACNSSLPSSSGLRYSSHSAPPPAHHSSHLMPFAGTSPLPHHLPPPPLPPSHHALGVNSSPPSAILFAPPPVVIAPTIPLPNSRLSIPSQVENLLLSSSSSSSSAVAAENAISSSSSSNLSAAASSNSSSSSSFPTQPSVRESKQLNNCASASLDVEFPAVKSRAADVSNGFAVDPLDEEEPMPMVVDALEEVPADLSASAAPINSAEEGHMDPSSASAIESTLNDDFLASCSWRWRAGRFVLLSPSGEHVKQAENKDPRLFCLETQPELCSQLLRKTFNLLYEMFYKSAGPAVKHKTIRVILRMVYYAQPDLLREVLRPQHFSSQLATMLSSIDLKLVVSALQLAELLMKKQQDVFSIYFRREGVLHQLKKLSEPEPVNTTPHSVTPGSTVLSNSDVLYPGTVDWVTVDPNVSGLVTSPAPLSASPLLAAARNITDTFTPGDSLSLSSMSSLPPHPLSLADTTFHQSGSFLAPPQPPISGMVTYGSPFLSSTPAAPTPHSGLTSLTPISQLLEQHHSLPASTAPYTQPPLYNPLAGAASSSSLVVSSSATSKSPASTPLAPPLRLPDALKKKRSGRMGNGGRWRRGSNRSEEQQQQVSFSELMKSLTSSSSSTTTASAAVMGVPTDGRQHSGGWHYSNHLAIGVPGSSTVTPTTVTATAASSRSSKSHSSGGRSGGGSRSGGFLAHLNPVRWGRSSSSNTSSVSTPSQEVREKSGGALSGGRGSYSSTPHGSGLVPQSSVSATSRQREHLKNWIREEAQRLDREHFGLELQGLTHPALSVLNRLITAIQQLQVQPEDSVPALTEIMEIVTDADISSFELIHSGLVSTLLKFLTDKDSKESKDNKHSKELSIQATRPASARPLSWSFNGPSSLTTSSPASLITFSSGDAVAAELSPLILTRSAASSSSVISASSTSVAPQDVAASIVKVPRDQRLRSFLHVFLGCSLDALTPGGGGCDSIVVPRFTGLLSKLMSCVNQLEQFPVKVHDLPGAGASGGRGGASSAIKFLNTHQLKCNLQRHPSCSRLKDWRGGPVKVDPLALVQAIERYLVVRGYARQRDSHHSQHEEDDDDNNSDDNTDEDDIDDTLAPLTGTSAQHKLEFLIGDQVLPYNMTVYQAIKHYSHEHVSSDAETDGEVPLSQSSIWLHTHTIHYRPVADDPPPKSTRGGKGKSSLSKSPSKKRGHGVLDTSLVTDVSLVGGSSIILDSLLTPTLPPSVTVKDPCLEVLALVKVLCSLNRYYQTLYPPAAYTMPVPMSDFQNVKLTAKANRQLQDPLVIMTGNLPPWLPQIAYACPFLFPFETRQLLFYAVSFDRDRAIQRLQEINPELTNGDSAERVTPRLDRKKKTVNRDDILKQAESVINEHVPSKAMLEIQYAGEVGSGLGPTLEFYAIVSRELKKTELELWRGPSVSVEEETSDGSSKSVKYVNPSSGLYPMPVPKSVKSAALNKIKSKFKFLGKFMAKAVMDSRMVDLCLHECMLRWMVGEERCLGLADVLALDPEFGGTLQQLHALVMQKRRLQDNAQRRAEDGYTTEQLYADISSITLDGCSVEDLSLNFTLPGYPSIDLKKGGSDLAVTIHNLEQYLQLVIEWLLRDGVWRQMEAFKEGFDTVFSMNQLHVFYPEELEQVFCGSNASSDWDVKVLAECCKPDHGYTRDSQAVKFLMQILSDYTVQEQRNFLQFTTGSPRLPVGGFRSLTPPLTIVRKTVQANENPDYFLPSVMTCVNYLKLPDYSTIDIMRAKLAFAISEGQHSFHLS